MSRKDLRSHPREDIGQELVWAEINLAHLKHNLRQLRRIVDRKTGILAIVKADAYGHGMVRVAKTLEKNGVRFFGVANIHEAMELRKVCPGASILVLGCPHPKQAPLYIKNNIIPTISCREDALPFEKLLAANLARSGFPVHVKIDTGMGRLGIWHKQAPQLIRELADCKHLSIQGVYTHFANADHREKKRTLKQIQYFQYLLKVLKQLKVKPRYVHAANSIGLVRFKKTHLNLVRPGLLLYGINPTGGPLPLRLKPVMILKTRVALIKEVETGRSISYGSTYKTKGRTKIAVLPIGYSHGYRVGFSNKTQVVIQGRRYPVVGRVTMDQTLVDLGPKTSVRRWDEVFLIGGGISANELAGHISSIPYEIVCSIHSRIPRF